MSKRRLGTNEARRVRMDLCKGRVESFKPQTTGARIPSKARHLALRETAFVHMGYNSCIQLTHGSMKAEATTFAPVPRPTTVKQVVPPHVATSK